MASLENKVIVITGSSSGIGAQTALHLAQYKPRLVLVARRQELLEKVAEHAQCREKGLPKDKLTAIGKASQPLKGIGENMDIAKVIQFLASDDSAFVTGESIHVDGGRHLMGASATAKKDMKS
ncbi:hydroxysteroid 11-beta-dehydrogenase 1-like protein [Haliotis cracherodii]|uniref:hydroxysteroid 11-beta-dehydrogenase 1-like protein n=1 Tax=Haliotis cracherodii TaxID=6455 RepID=UPI0039EB5676